MIINTVGKKIFKDYDLTEHFKASEAFYLPKLGVYYIPSEAELSNVLVTLDKLEEVRSFLAGCLDEGDSAGIKITSMLRPQAVWYVKQELYEANSGGYRVEYETGQVFCMDYNKSIGGSNLSQHILGKAVDFQHKSLQPDRVRALLTPELERLGICMEDLPGSSWVHIDCRLNIPKSGRFFKP